MKNYNIDHINGIITLTASFIRKASTLGTKEYNEMLQLRRNHPNYQFVRAEASKQKTTNKSKNLTYTNMELFIKNSFTVEEAKSRLEVLEKVKKLSKIQANPYKYVHDWFIKQFPNYKSVELSKNSEEETATSEAASAELAHA